MDDIAVFCHTSNKDDDMRKTVLNGHKVSVYDGIDELPMRRFHKYNMLLMVDAGIGGDLSALDSHLERVAAYVRNDRKEEAGKEIENLRQSVWMILQETSPKHLAFMALVDEVDGVKCEDMSDEGLRRTYEMLNGTPYRQMTDLEGEVKKKIDSELMMCYPEVFESGKMKEYYDLMKARTEEMLKNVVEGETDERRERIQHLTDMLTMFGKPIRYSGRDGAEVEQERQYERMCLLITQNIGKDAKDMTVMEYYAAYNLAKEQNKKPQNRFKTALRR